METTKDFRWGSHIPMCRAAISSFPIIGTLELGSGYNSSKLFFDSCDKVISIENDEEWINKLKKDIIEDDNHKFIYCDINDKSITRSTKPWNIKNEKKTEILSFYKSYKTKDLNLLFIDCYCGFRFTSLQNMYSDFDVIIFHDIHEPHYEYNHFQNYLKYFCFLDFSFFTGILINQKFQKMINTFKKNYKIFSEEYCNKYSASIISELKENDCINIPDRTTIIKKK